MTARATTRSLPHDLGRTIWDTHTHQCRATLGTPSGTGRDAQERPHSPRDYLLATGDVDRVIPLAETLGGGEAA